MDSPAVEDIINWFCEKLEQSGIKVKKVILFGSYSKKNHSNSSDIDLAVISYDFADVHILDRIPMVSDAEWSTTRKFMIPLDLILLTPEEYEQENSIRMSFIRQGTDIPIQTY